VRRRWLVAGALVLAGALPGVAWAVLSGSAPGADPAVGPVASGAGADPAAPTGDPAPARPSTTAVRPSPTASGPEPTDAPDASGARPPTGRPPGAPADEPSTDVPTAGAERPDPVDAAVLLTRRRADVLADGDPGGLGAVTSPGSPAHRADRALLDRLAADGVTLDGLAAVVEDAALVPALIPAPPTAADGAAGDDTPASTTGDAAAVVDVRVRSSLSAHTRRTPSGDVPVPPQPAREVVLRLTWTDAGWRVTDVRPG
jgi:hypothetical protein